jgi:glycosyltransferase involved in cell wall biosynthesis
MAMQCPIILGVEGEAQALLEDARAGIAIEPENARQLAEAMRRLADDPALAARFGRAGREFAAVNFDRAKVAARYLDLLEDVAARRPIQAAAPLAASLARAGE